jgi:hypothetical protein
MTLRFLGLECLGLRSLQLFSHHRVVRVVISRDLFSPAHFTYSGWRTKTKYDDQMRR